MILVGGELRLEGAAILSGRTRQVDFKWNSGRLQKRTRNPKVSGVASELRIATSGDV